MNAKEALAAWREKNARAQKAVPVEIDGVGTVFVRVTMISESDYLNSIREAAGKDETSVYPFLMANLLCNEDGSRLTDEERIEALEVFAGSTFADYVALRDAATQGLKAKVDDSGN